MGQADDVDLDRVIRLADHLEDAEIAHEWLTRHLDGPETIGFSWTVLRGARTRPGIADPRGDPLPDRQVNDSSRRSANSAPTSAADRF